MGRKASREASTAHYRRFPDMRRGIVGIHGKTIKSRRDGLTSQSSCASRNTFRLTKFHTATITVTTILEMR